MLLRKKELFTTPYWKTRHKKKIRRFSFFLTMSRVNEKRVRENGRNCHVKISKAEFRFSFPPIFKPLWRVLWRRRIQGRNISQYRSHTKEFLNRPNLNKICDRLGNGLFFPMYYLQKQSQQFKERTRCWPCFGHSFLLCSLLRSHLRLWLATRMISAHCAPWTPFLQEHDLISAPSNNHV